MFLPGIDFSASIANHIGDFGICIPFTLLIIRHTSSRHKLTIGVFTCLFIFDVCSIVVRLISIGCRCISSCCQRDAIVLTVQVAREHEVSTKGSSRNLDVVVQDKVVAMMLSALFGFAQHLYPGGIVNILCIFVLYILLILMAIGHGIVLIFVGIGPLPAAAGNG